MTERRMGIIINGATGRMGTTQHMANLLAIAADADWCWAMVIG